MNKICCYHLDMTCKRIIVFIGAMLVTLQCIAQDAIIFRDGRVKPVKIIQVNNDKTLYKDSGDKMAAEEFVENTQLFMLKFKTRGNVVFNSKGERVYTVSEHTQIPKDAIVIYYKDGKEVPAYSLTMDANVVTFSTSKRDKGNPVLAQKTDIFMICYPDGTRDILTNLAMEEQKEREREAAALRKKAEREAEIADSIQKASTAEESASAKSPRKATIVTKKGARMKVWVCSETATMVSYKKTNTPKAPIFQMSKAKIKNIIY